ncbi:MAG: taurine dioxygenase [Chitinophagales bacterium]|nr:MAG: taurine dioxygenase [Chitinophagales bacterium]
MRESFFNAQHLPLVIEPEDNASADSLFSWLKHNRYQVREKLLRYGAILFRGFEINQPALFEQLALHVDSNLKNDYLGTSPRNRVEGTTYVFTASELPAHYPIMQHCEMSYLEHPPKRLFFYCDTEPDYGGETPVCDFRKVYAEMDPALRGTFEKKGVLHVRNYSGLSRKSALNLWELKRWDEIFLTTDRAEVERLCRENKMDFAWKADGGLRILHRNPAFLSHPETGEPAWFNHLQVFHVAAAALEYEKIHQRQRRLKTLLWSIFLKLAVPLKKATTAPADQSMHVLFGDGTEIPDHYVQHIEEIIWKNLVIFSWKKNDVLAIDNFSTAHGRLPYEGKRRILVCWSA